MDVMLQHCFTQDEGRADVVVVIAQQLGDGFAYRLESGKVNDGLRLVVGEDAPEEEP